MVLLLIERVPFSPEELQLGNVGKNIRGGDIRSAVPRGIGRLFCRHKGTLTLFPKVFKVTTR